LAPFRHDIYQKGDVSLTQNENRKGFFKSPRKPWTEEEVDYVKKNFGTTPLEEMVKHLDRSISSIQDKAYKMGLKSARIWSKEEDEALLEMWGKFSYKAIMKRTGRTLNGVKIRAQRLGLRDPRQYTNHISVNDFAKLIGRGYTIVKNWHNTRGLPLVYKNVTINQKGAYICLEDFWAWFKQNKGALDLSTIEPNALGPEPEWVKDKRKADFYNRNKPNYILWTPEEDKKLLRLIQEGKSYNEMSKIFNRTQGAIKRRILDFNYPHPARIDNHNEYSEEEIERILKMNQEGYSFEHIAQTLGPHRSAAGCRGKLERLGFKFRRGTAYLPKDPSTGTGES
jgi:uncharacterized protein YycO